MIQLLLIAIIIATTVFHLWWTSQKVEEPFAVAGISPSDLPPIADDPNDDPMDLPWIASWSDMDRTARYGQTCHVVYTEAGPCDTTIQTVSVSCEAGMPHTRPGDRIILPETISLAGTYDLSRKAREPETVPLAGFPDRESIIRHELVHILQRRHPDSWLEFYRRNWSFTFAPTAPQGMPQAIQNARRSNPDTWDSRSGGPWACWQHRWWPVAVYRNPANPTLRDATTVWWDSATGQVLEDPPADWTAFFGSPSQDEHPHEIAATMMVANDTSSEAGRRLKNWWRSEGRRAQVDADSVCPL